ncbi:hypothetical protein Pta02_23560 [Planobispora takensis]|uniref:Uncharacterized protein n=1 Tax=Planobispora takensis TaxID=1367882 RepID=A0A8J3SX28_9ACTN|nr:hypothetical protein Pta02_23560 [Planobispora takensis]
MAAASPAAAASARCVVATNHCETNIIAAPRHFIDWHLDSSVSGYGCSWRVLDVNTRVVVGSGRIGAFRHASGSIPGLFGYYRLELFNCGSSAFGWIDNEHP